MMQTVEEKNPEKSENVSSAMQLERSIQVAQYFFFVRFSFVWLSTTKLSRAATTHDDKRKRYYATRSTAKMGKRPFRFLFVRSVRFGSTASLKSNTHFESMRKECVQLCNRVQCAIEMENRRSVEC